MQIAIIGATGLVGTQVLAILETLSWPAESVRCVASSKSAGQSIRFSGVDKTIQDLAEFDFSSVDVAIFSAGGSLSKQYVPKALAEGCYVVDNTSVYRLDKASVLCIPRVLPVPHCADDQRLFSVPNCSTVQLVAIVYPLQKAFGIESISVSTYQSYSGAGRKALASYQAGDLSLVAHIGQETANGYCEEESKMIHETKRLLNHDIPIWPTTIRTPTPVVHGESVSVRLAQMTDMTKITRVLSESSVNRRVDDASLIIDEAKGRDEVLWGRLRWDPVHRQLMLFSLSDNLRLGAATTAVDIAMSVVQPLLRRNVGVC